MCLMTSTISHEERVKLNTTVLIGISVIIAGITCKHIFVFVYLCKDLMAKVIKDTPEDPIVYLIKVLKRLYSEGSKVGLFFFLPS